MKKKESIEFVTKTVIENIIENFLEIIKKQKLNTIKNITETLFLIKTIKKHLQNIIKLEYYNSENLNFKFEHINTLNINALYYYKYNIGEIISQFCINRKKYKTICDSVAASLTIKLFDNVKDSCFVHIFNSQNKKFELSNYNKPFITNINKNRLSSTPELAYPENDRPRGDNDLKSVEFHRSKLQNGESLEPIWIIEKKGKRYILDGFHRLAASYIENKEWIDSYYITC
jgi:hypothetical protein